MSADRIVAHFRHAPMVLGGGALWLVTAAAAVMVGEQSGLVGSPMFYMVGTMATLAYLAPLAGFAGLHARYRHAMGRIGTGAVYLALIGTSLMFVATLATTASGYWLAAMTPPFLLGFLIAAAASLVLGLVLLRSGGLPAWVGVLLVLLFPLSGILGASLGSAAVGIVQGIAWIAVGNRILRERPATGSEVAIAPE